MYTLSNRFKNWVNTEVDKQLDKDPFSSLPIRMRIGIFLLIGSFVIGYGVPILLLVIPSVNHLSTNLISGSAVYIFCWILGVIGLSLAGRDCIKYPKFFMAKFLKMLFPKFFKTAIIPVGNQKKYSLVSRFPLVHLILMLSLISILILVAKYSKFSSHTIVIWIIIVVCCVHEAFYIHGMFAFRSNFFFKTIKGKEYFDNQTGILFRFDDGPHPVYTPQILDILKTEGLTALFAVTGKNAEMYPEIVARIKRENHIIANHTYSHPRNIVLLGYDRLNNEITGTNKIIQSITGESPKYFCPPIGHKNSVMGKVLKDLGLIPVMWDIRTCDTYAPFEKIMAIIKKKLKSPAIIMFHDAIFPWSKNDRESTVLALSETIKLLKEKRYL